MAFVAPISSICPGSWIQDLGRDGQSQAWELKGKWGQSWGQAKRESRLYRTVRKNALSMSRCLAQTPPPFSQLLLRLLAPLSPCTKAPTTLSPCFGHAGIVLASWFDHIPSLLRAFSHAVPFARNVRYHPESYNRSDKNQLKPV